MAKHRSHSVAFERQVAQEFIGGETLHGLSKRHDISRQLIRIWVGKYEAGALDDDVQAADLLQEYEAKIAALERMVGRQALEIEFLKGALKSAPRPRSGARARSMHQLDCDEVEEGLEFIDAEHLGVNSLNDLFVRDEAPRKPGGGYDRYDIAAERSQMIILPIEERALLG
ncbi:Transposase [Rhizobiales bacterium GAS191]|nr:Transposase [Rhizobiales bacterium GAS191]